MDRKHLFRITLKRKGNIVTFINSVGKLQLEYDANEGEWYYKDEDIFYTTIDKFVGRFFGSPLFFYDVDTGEEFEKVTLADGKINEYVLKKENVTLVLDVLDPFWERRE